MSGFRKPVLIQQYTVECDHSSASRCPRVLSNDVIRVVTPPFDEVIERPAQQLSRGELQMLSTQ